MVLDMMSSTAWVLPSSSSIQFFLPPPSSSYQTLRPSKRPIPLSPSPSTPRLLWRLERPILSHGRPRPLGRAFPIRRTAFERKKNPHGCRWSSSICRQRTRPRPSPAEREEREEEREEEGEKKERRRREEGEKKERRKRKVGTLDMRQQGVSIPATTSHHFTPLHTTSHRRRLFSVRHSPCVPAILNCASRH
jgi:hypothetical protein